jgi:glucan phosphoethanolaminetransferase (alkaline phosphatase superfamily)
MKIDNNLIYFIDIIEKPIIKETNLFLWSIILMILPTMINALWINGSEMSFLYIIQTNRFGASIPYIFFVPFVLSYVISTIQLVFRKNYVKWIIYSVLLFLMSLNIFLLLNFSTMVSPMMFTLLMETTGSETSGFISTYLFSKGTQISFAILFLLTILIVISDKIRFHGLAERLSSSFVTKLSILVIMAYFMYRGIVSLIYFLTLFSCRTPSDVEEWSHGYKYETNTITVSIYSIYD